MPEHWLYCPDLRPGRNALEPAEARHAVRSLRLWPGDAAAIFDGRGRVGRGVLTPAGQTINGTNSRAGRASQRKQPTTVEISAIETVPPPSRTLTLIVPGCKGARLDWLVEKCTELGVWRLIFAEFERSVVHVGAPHVVKLRRTAIEACKQCHRPWLPRVETAGALPEVLAAAAHERLLFAHLADEATPLGQWLSVNSAVTREVVVVIGPEGGLSPSEVACLHQAGGQLVRLAEHVLRVETAAITTAAAWAAFEGRARRS